MNPREVEADLREHFGEWSTNSNECFSISLIRGDETTAVTFRPEFTYAIFGEEESVFGYEDLNIALSFASHNLTPHLEIKHGKTHPAIRTSEGPDVNPTDIRKALNGFLPEHAFTSQTRAEALRDDAAAEFRPPGEKVASYQQSGENFEIWSSSLREAPARALLENMQILAPMFIDGGSKLEIEQDWTLQRWRLFSLYKLDVSQPPQPHLSPYSLAGYATSYRSFTLSARHPQSQVDVELFSSGAQSLDSFLAPLDSDTSNFHAPPAFGAVTSPLDLPSRERLAQFLILPPYQRAGHGRHLYDAVYDNLTSAPHTREFTVEDPNESFDELRDTCDLLRLRAHSAAFAALEIERGVDPERLASSQLLPTDLIVSKQARLDICQEVKIDPRQFARLVEMQTLASIPPLHRSRARLTRKEKSSNGNDRAYYFWRLYVKERLFFHNKDQLVQMERDERIEKLEAALDSVAEGYERCLERMTKLEHEGSTTEGPAKTRKRKVIDDDDEADGTHSFNITQNKKARGK